MVIQKNGEKCSCGNNGCFEAYCSMKVLKTKIAAAKNLRNITGKELYEIIKRDNVEISDILDEFMQNLSIGLSNYINIFEPEAICIGGSFAYYKDLLLDCLIDRMNKKNMTFNGSLPKIVTAQMGNDAGIIGSTLF